jgi:hypothetical protein
MLSVSPVDDFLSADWSDDIDYHRNYSADQKANPAAGRYTPGSGH